MAKQHSPGFLAVVNSVKPHIRECQVADVAARLHRQESLCLVDVREDSEWIAGHLPGALHLSKGIIERDIEERLPNHAQEIILYCGGGFRSALAAYNLQIMGYTNVVSMDGGWRGWTDAGLPVSRDSA